MSAVAGDAADGGDGSALAFVTVTVGGLRLALPLAAVSAVIRLPELVRIPLGPPSLDGLAQWHGEAVPVLDLGKALGARALDRPDGASATRETRVVLVGHRGQPVGLRVDAMAGILRADPDRIDPVTQEEGGLDPVLLDGLLRDGPATILKLDTLIDRQFGDGAEAERADRGTASAAGFGPATVREMASAGGLDRKALLVFGVAGQEFALPVDRVREVLPAPREVARMARAKAHLLGVMAVRDRLLPLVGLRALFGLDGTGDQAAGRRVVVVRTGDRQTPVGVLVDEVREILRLDPALIDPVPPLLAREPEFEDLDGIARADGGRRLVSVLSAERLFRHGAAIGEDAGAEGGGMEPARSAAESGIGERFVVFRLAGAEYGLPVSAVREVLRRPDNITPLPNAPDFVAGVLTLRGEVLPLIDQRRLLNLPAVAANSTSGPERGRVVVVGRDGVLVGLLVDGLAGLLTVPAERIGPAPAVSAAQRRLIRRVATLDTAGGARLILLMDADSLLDMDRLAALLVTPQ